MVICEKHKFIYLRIPKNASSSLAEFFVNNFCEKTDKWTEVNDCGIVDNNVDSKVIKKYRHHYRFIHLTLQELVDNEVLTREDVEDKDTISVIRDPFMRQLSLYFFLQRGRATPEGFRQMFKNGRHENDASNHILQTDYARLDGVDKGTWWNYSNLSRHLENFCEDRGVVVETALKRYKDNIKPKHESLIDEYYDQATKDAVRKYYEKDFEKLDNIGG